MRPLTLVLALTALQLIPSAPSPGEQLFARFGEYVDALRTQAGIPGLTAAVVGENDLLWERGFGQQDLGRSLAAQPDTPYFLDGLTQLFTATLVLQCAEEGRLSLSDPIAKYDADSPWAGATLAQALSHIRPVVLDSRVLAEMRAINPSDPDFLSDLITLFLDEAPSRTDALRRAIAAGDSEATWRAAHAFKSGCAHIGALRLVAICDAIERQGRGGRIDDAAFLFGTLEEEFPEVEAMLLPYVGSPRR